MNLGPGVFQRIVRQRTPLLLRFGNEEANDVEPCAVFRQKPGQQAHSSTLMSKPKDRQLTEEAPAGAA